LKEFFTHLERLNLKEFKIQANLKVIFKVPRQP